MHAGAQGVRFSGICRHAMLSGGGVWVDVPVENIRQGEGNLSEDCLKRKIETIAGGSLDACRQTRSSAAN